MTSGPRRESTQLKSLGCHSYISYPLPLLLNRGGGSREKFYYEKRIINRNICLSLQKCLNGIQPLLFDVHDAPSDRGRRMPQGRNKPQIRDISLKRQGQWPTIKRRYDPCQECITQLLVVNFIYFLLCKL